ncbi:MAG: hypothetical protein AB2669_03115 [Candidatus Thiodiazotropha endolucinida]|nr:hypothetical protein [Candidatus Thiodiazotropha taylori]MCW4226223.1 hypothetical protein [Candidatus Thiodiazotropha endolucinida]MCG7884119.1 hypothetical protein [Candidatus Thiodiazotropha taylori]MCG7887787.1 hypothetical protein [Candidatus Thiodiazotropha taylori]MCG7891955.1 hypothetical protein [Candidatus Thiodiazotropha taylori]
MAQWIVLILLSLSSALLPAEELHDGCLKRVFMHYCLGGSLDRLLQRRPVDMDPIVNGDRAGIIYTKGRERIYVMAFQGRIYKVLKTYEPSNQVTLQRLQRTLSEKYGKHRDISHLPKYARNMAGKIGAVRRGEGELRYHWQLPASPWHVELTWTRKLGISLAYLVNTLDRQQREADESSL